MLVVVLGSADRGMLVGWLGTRNGKVVGVEVQAPGPGSWSRSSDMEPRGRRPQNVHGRRWSGNPGTRRGSHSDEPDGPAKEEEAVIT